MKEKANQHLNIWGSKELNVLNDLSLSNREVAEILGKTYQVVKQKRRSENITLHKKGIDSWTKEELQILLKNKKLNNLGLSEILKRTPQAISLKRNRLGIPFESNEWEEEEFNYLIKDYGLKSNREIAEFLGRTINAISSMASELGISKRNDYWNKNELKVLADNFEVDIPKLVELIPTKRKEQIIYKKAHLKHKANKNIREQENINNDIPFSKNSKINRYIDLLSVLKVGESFEIPNKDYNLFLEARNLVKNKLFKSKKDTENTRRIWRLD